MDRDVLLSAISRFNAGERPYRWVKPDWYLVPEDGARYPLKYVYAMALGLDRASDTHTGEAKKAATDAGFKLIHMSGQAEKSRLPADQLRRVTAEFIWSAVQRLLKGEVAKDYGFSVDYDLVADGGVRLAPKQVFGLAATEALGFMVKPNHFTGGRNTICFELLESAGYKILPKGNPIEGVDLHPDPTDLEWSEGRTILVRHYRRERASGLSKAKKSEFIRVHGRLFCEICNFDPSFRYGELADACIEVHHDAVQVANMESDHVTTLDQLKCLCANCHRVLHRQMAMGCCG